MVEFVLYKIEDVLKNELFYCILFTIFELMILYKMN